MKRFLVGAVAGVALAGLVIAALLLFTDLRVTDKSPSEEAAQLLLTGSQEVDRCCGKPPSVSVPNLVGNTVGMARGVLKHEGLKTKIVSPKLGRHEGLGPSAVIHAQQPSAGTLASPGVTLTLFVKNE